MKIITSCIQKESEENYFSYLASYLNTFSFFCRFKHSTIVDFIKKGLIKVEKVDKNEILETANDDEHPNAPVHIIMDGKVCLNQHLLHEPSKSICLALATTGKILGVRHLDSGTSC